MKTVDDLSQLFQTHGDSQYGGEQVSQIEHALQAATLAELEHASPELIVAALLHDVGHLLHDLPDDAPDKGIDDHHEMVAHNYVRVLFPDAVSEPIRLHVAAKRYLCATDAAYAEDLSQPSVISLALQGGPMTANEVNEFDRNPFAEDAIRLRRWDDAAKIPNHPTPTLSHFSKYVIQTAQRDVDA